MTAAAAAQTRPGLYFFLPSVKKLLRLESSPPRLESREELGRVCARPEDDTSATAGVFSLLTQELISSCKINNAIYNNAMNVWYNSNFTHYMA